MYVYIYMYPHTYVFTQISKCTYMDMYYKQVRMHPSNAGNETQAACRPRWSTAGTPGHLKGCDDLPMQLLL